MPDKPIAVITGAAQGIGLACVKALISDGFRCVLLDIKEEAVHAAAEKLGEHARALTCDMSSPDQINAAFDEIAASEGAISALVNNAGIALPGSFLDYDLDDFEQVIKINLTGAFLALQRAARSMVAHGIEGAIVNMSSVNAQVSIPAIPAYCASKGGLMQITKAAAIDLAPHNIRVNAVGPGSIDTEMMAGVNANPQAFAVAMSRTPLKRPGTAEEVANVVAFLVSDKSSYVTGETIYIDGGRLGMNYTC